MSHLYCRNNFVSLRQTFNHDKIQGYINDQGTSRIDGHCQQRIA